VQRCGVLVEIIGEAAKNITEDFKRNHSEIHWAAIVGQRNVLSHKYFALKHERIWIVVTEHILDLINKLEPLIPPVQPDKPRRYLISSGPGPARKAEMSNFPHPQPPSAKVLS
jgi:hypothetical protein